MKIAQYKIRISFSHLTTIEIMEKYTYEEKIAIMTDFQVWER